MSAMRSYKAIPGCARQSETAALRAVNEVTYSALWTAEESLVLLPSVTRLSALKKPASWKTFPI